MRLRPFLITLATTALLAITASCKSAAPAASAVPAAPTAATRPTTRPAAPAINRFDSTIAGFEKKDRISQPAPGGTLFVGSSTFAMWKTLEDDFKEFHAINRGFGGSTIPEVIYYTDRIVLPYKPATIVFYAGENDIASGTPADRVSANFQAFVQKVRQTLPQVRIIYISMKASPSRQKWAKEILRANDLIRAFAQATPNTHFVNTNALLHDENGAVNMEYFIADRLHLSRKGQELWMPTMKKALLAGDK